MNFVFKYFLFVNRIKICNIKLFKYYFWFVVNFLGILVVNFIVFVMVNGCNSEEFLRVVRKVFLMMLYIFLRYENLFKNKII